ncbi:unnamed protein product [Boreogadus saida]
MMRCMKVMQRENSPASGVKVAALEDPNRIHEARDGPVTGHGVGLAGAPWPQDRPISVRSMLQEGEAADVAPYCCSVRSWALRASWSKGWGASPAPGYSAATGERAVQRAGCVQ